MITKLINWLFPADRIWATRSDEMVDRYRKEYHEQGNR